MLAVAVSGGVFSIACWNFLRSVCASATAAVLAVRDDPRLFRALVAAVLPATAAARLAMAEKLDTWFSWS